MLITFSGLDGSGKSTLISHLKDSLERDNTKVAVSHMNYDVGLYSLLRSLGRRRSTEKSPVPEEQTESAATKTGKSFSEKVRRLLVWNKTLRFLLFPLDVLFFLGYRIYVERLKREVLIMDRYFYDTMIDLTGAKQSFRTRLLSMLTPTPNLSIYLDCNPENAFDRKREFSIDYLKTRRHSYLQLMSQFPRMLVLSTDQDLEATSLSLTSAVRERMVAR